jgi:hypothetical protein
MFLRTQMGGCSYLMLVEGIRVDDKSILRTNTELRE